MQKLADAESKASRSIDFEKVAKEWWARHEPTLAPNTTKGYLPAMARAEAYFAGDRIDKLRPVDIVRFLDVMIDEHDFADKTARTQLMVVNLICRFAVSRGYMDVNPCADLSVPKGLPKNKRHMPPPEDIKSVKESDELFGKLILYTGLRKGEALALTWGDVHLEERYITVSKSLYHVSNKPMIKEPKTAAGVREVPIPDKLLPFLHPGEPDEVVFGGDHYLTETQWQKLWADYQKATGVTCTPHQLRHAFATMLFESDLPPEEAMDILGHAQVSTTREIYVDIREEHRKRVRSRLTSIDLAD